MKILNKQIVNAYAKAIKDVVENWDGDKTNVKNIKETLCALYYGWMGLKTSITNEEYAAILATLGKLYEIADEAYDAFEDYVPNDCTLIWNPFKEGELNYDEFIVGLMHLEKLTR